MRPHQDSSPYPWSQRHLNFTVPTNHPFPRYGAAANSLSSKDGSIYIMGGLIHGSTVKGDLWMIESAPNNLSCYPVATTSEGPGPRVGHAALLVGNAFIVFGGDTKTDETDMLDDTLYLLNTCALLDSWSSFESLLTVDSHQAMVESCSGRPPSPGSLRPLAQHHWLQDLHFRWSSRGLLLQRSSHI